MEVTGFCSVNDLRRSPGADRDRHAGCFAPFLLATGRVRDRRVRRIAVAPNTRHGFAAHRAANRPSVFRVTQEALRSVVRHAGATQVTVGSPLRTATGSCRVVDDGRGFDAASAFRRDEAHFGVQLMADAARRAGAGLPVSTAACSTSTQTGNALARS